jgi:AraC-like DNA-binding protein
MLTDYNINHTAELTDSRGWKWTGTGDGLRLFKPSGELQMFYTKDGLSNNFIQAILQDSHHNIWITTSYGINKLQIDSISGNVHFTSFDSNAGTLDGEYTNQAVYESLSGDLYFGGINGFSILKPSRLLQRKLPFKPVFTNLFLKGEKVEPGKSYGNRVILINSAPYVKKIHLNYDQNFLTFQFSALNYQNPSQTFYRYQLIGIDKSWRETFSRRDDGVNGHGVLEISYTNLPHGNYKLRVMASNNNKEWNGPVAELDLTINAPWWRTLPAIICFVVLASALILALIFAYTSHTRKSLERTHREELLLLRIRNLIDQQNVLLAEKEKLPVTVEEHSNAEESKTSLNQAESEFLERAMKLVEMNIEVTDYSVEQLSRDLNMDRTGLYRKLITLLDKSPSLFIRNVRLEKAAQLILEGKLNISEITERVGFSSSSYLGKCFFEQYGCRPSEYAHKMKNQHH